MSFDLAVWEGRLPRTDADALAEFKRLYAQHLEDGPTSPPSDRIKTFIDAITETYPDIMDLPDDKIDDGVWSDGPLINNASGPFFYFGMVWSRAEEVAAFVADVAEKHGLVCFDPQSGRCAQGSRR
jgi:hypothetical protein